MIARDVLSTKQVNLTCTSATLGFGLTRAVGVAYKTINGVWRLKFNMSFAIGAGTTATVAIAGITFHPLYTQGLAVKGSSSNYSWAYARSNESNIECTTGTNTTVFYVSGDVELASKPTWLE